MNLSASNVRLTIFLSVSIASSRQSMSFMLVASVSNQTDNSVITGVSALIFRESTIALSFLRPAANDFEAFIDLSSIGPLFGEYDVCQEIYGLLQYIGALSSIWLNEGATLFRRKYYNNGSHAGYLFYMNETQEDGSRRNYSKRADLARLRTSTLTARAKTVKRQSFPPLARLRLRMDLRT